MAIATEDTKETRTIEMPVYDAQGGEVGVRPVPAEVFGAPWNADLVHQTIVSMQSNARQAVAHTKDRGEVRGGGRKPWRQKGTGRARHGSRRSPIWTGGGVTFGPRNERDYSKKINRKAGRRALASVLSRKHADGEVLLVDALSFSEPKTKFAREVLRALSGASGREKLTYDKGRRALIVLPEKDGAVLRSFANIPAAHVEEARNINPLLVLTYKYLVIVDPGRSLETLKERVKI